MATNELLLILFFVLLGGEIALAYGIGVILNILNKQEEPDTTPRPKIGFHKQYNLSKENEEKQENDVFIR